MTRRQKPKRRKSHNLKRQAAQVTNGLFRNCAVIRVDCGGLNKFSELWHMPTRKPLLVTRKVSASLSELRHQWGVVLVWLGRYQDGREYIKMVEHDCRQPYLYSELYDHLTESQIELVEAQNHKHTVGVGWIATTAPVQWDEADVFEIFKMVGAFDDRWRGICCDELKQAIEGDDAAKVYAHIVEHKTCQFCGAGLEIRQDKGIDDE